MKNFRKIKITQKFVRTKWESKYIPALIMQGEYMRQAGFQINTECRVEIENGKITILAL